MSDTIAGAQDTFLSLYRKMALPVFRYHLVRCGDWQEAQALTRETFLTAQACYHPNEIPQEREAVWLFSAAVWVQLYKKRGLDIGDSILPTQTQVAQYVRVAEVAQAWGNLPLQTADGLALFIFGGLELPEAAEVIHCDLPTIQEKLYRHLQDQVDLRLLAGEIQPVGYFINRLESELRERAYPRRRAVGQRVWRFTYRHHRSLVRAGRILPLLIFLALLFWAIWYFSSPVQPFSDLPPAAQGSAVWMVANGVIPLEYCLPGNEGRLTNQVEIPKSVIHGSFPSQNTALAVEPEKPLRLTGYITGFQSSA